MTAWLLLILAAGAVLRLYNLAWGAPYYHFHIDEHFVLSGADMLARDTREAALAELQHVFALIAQEHQDRGQALPKDTTEIVHA